MELSQEERQKFLELIDKVFIISTDDKTIKPIRVIFEGE